VPGAADILLKEDSAVLVTNAKQYRNIVSPFEIEDIPEGSQHTWCAYEESHNADMKQYRNGTSCT
jgi:hypothetical protein